MNESTGERLVCKVMKQGKNAVYVNLGPMGADRPMGFFIESGKPVPTNTYKNLRLRALFHG